MSFPKIYTVNGPSSTSSSTLPSWLSIKQRPRTVNGHRKRTKTRHEVGQLELVQDFAFPQAAIRIKTTPDGRHAVGTGTYKPMMKVWDLEGLTVKFERVTDAENVDFVFLSDDWTKTLHLQRDRSLCLHTQSGLHHSIRLPTYGRCLAYHPPSAEVLVGCTGTDVYRLNLEEGRYMAPLPVARGWKDGRSTDVEGVNVVDVNPRHGLWSFGLDGGGGVVEFWDPRSRSALTRLVLPGETLLPVQPVDESTAGVTRPQQRLEVTAMMSHPTDGLSLAVGTSTGHTLLYDLRSPTPFAVKDQGYGEALVKVDWLRGGGAQEDSGRVVSADSKVIKIWDKGDPSTNHLSLHPPSTLVDLHPVPSSGLLFAACDAPQLSSYYVPELGPAPRWAGFLDSITEEMADDPTEKSKGAFRDFKFVDRAELDMLGLTHLIGTPALKPYMHGYFLSLKLYSTARLIANPQSYAEYRDRLVADKLASKAESRIRARKDQPKVNKALAERLRRVEEREAEAARRKRAKAKLGAGAGTGADGEDDAMEEDDGGEGGGRKPGGVLRDARFKELFENPDFEVDEESREFALLNPATADKNRLEKAAAGKEGRRRTAVESEDEESEGESSDLEESDDEEDDEDDEQDDEEGEESEEEAGGRGAAGGESDSEESDDGDLIGYDPRNVPESSRRAFPKSAKITNRSAPRLVNSIAGPSTGSRTFGQRLAQSRPGAGSLGGKGKGKDEGIIAMRRHMDGGMEMSFVPRTTAREGEEQDEYSGGTRRSDRQSAAGQSGAEGGEGQKGGGGKRRGDTGRKVERFGAGLEKGGAGTNGDGGRELGQAERQGRDKRRFGGRSGSKNAFRRR